MPHHRVDGANPAATSSTSRARPGFLYALKILLIAPIS
jgi:hypothetical protein